MPAISVEMGASFWARISHRWIWPPEKTVFLFCRAHGFGNYIIKRPAGLLITRKSVGGRLSDPTDRLQFQDRRRPGGRRLLPVRGCR